jgi:hypothetical protein
MEHDPGAPPQRPQEGASERLGIWAEGWLLELTANRLSARAVLDEPHSGHLTFSSVVIERTSCSNLLLQALQVYS